MALSLDSPPPVAVLERLCTEPGFVDARFIVLPED
jgi:hypothetical protein